MYCRRKKDILPIRIATRNVTRVASQRYPVLLADINNLSIAIKRSLIYQNRGFYLVSLGFCIIDPRNSGGGGGGGGVGREGGATSAALILNAAWANFSL